MEALFQKINEQYDNMSASLKKVAQYLRKDPESFAVNSAVEMGKKIGVSETSVIRFCHSLGFKGFSSLQKEVRDAVFSQRSTLKAYTTKSILQEGETSSLKKVMQMDAINIQRVADSLQEGTFNEAVAKISSASNIVVAGVRSSHGMAQWFTFALNLIKGNTSCYRPDVDDVFLHLTSMSEQSVFVAFSFHRYALDTLHLAEEAKKRGAFVIGITDNELAPIRDYSSLILAVQLPVTSTLDAAPAVFSLMNAIITAVALENKEVFIKRQEEYESFDGKKFFSSL